MLEFAWKNVEVPAVSAVSVAALRDHLRLAVDEADENTLAALLAAAQSAVEAKTRRILSPSTAKICYSGAGRELSLRVFPANSIISVVADGVELTGWALATGGLRPVLRLSDWTQAAELVVTVACGHSENFPPPPELVQLVKMLAADFYNNREMQIEQQLAENRAWKFICELHTWLEV